MEPERKIEKWLRAFAKKRREQSGAPMELHPVTRRLLQSEAARRGPKPAEGKFFLTLRNLLRSGWAYGVGAAVLVVAVALLLPLLPGKKPQQLARGTETESLSATEDLAKKVAAPPESAVPLPATAPAQPAPTRSQPAPAEARGAAARTRNEEKLQFELAAKDVKQLPEPLLREPVPGRPAAAFQTAAAPASTPEPARRAAADLPPDAANATPKTFGGAALSPGSRADTISVVTAKAADSRLGFGDSPPPIAGTATPGQAQNQVQFHNLAPETDALNSTAATRRPVPAFGAMWTNGTMTDAAVLTSFAVEQNGREMRVVDSDGSVYSGYVQLGPGLDRVAADSQSDLAATTLTRAKESLDKAPLADAAQNYSFRVSGTNRSLSQSVVFAGNLLAITNANAAQLKWNASAGTAGRSQARTATGGASQSLLLNSRISGTALIDNSRKLEINAAPVQPANK